MEIYSVMGRRLNDGFVWHIEYLVDMIIELLNAVMCEVISNNNGIDR